MYCLRELHIIGNRRSYLLSVGFVYVRLEMRDEMKGVGGGQANGRMENSGANRFLMFFIEQLKY